jgi:hypothetical protein
VRATLLVLTLGVVPSLMAADEPKGPPQGWKEYTPSDKSFTVWLPDSGGRRSERTRDFRVKAHRGKVNVIQLQLNDGMTYNAATLRISSIDFARIKAGERIEMFRDLFLDEYKGKVKEEVDIKQGRVPGKEYLIETNKGMARLQVYVAGSVMYEAYVLGSAEQVDGKDVKTFLESYKLPERATDPTAAKPSSDKPGATPSAPTTPRKPGTDVAALTKADWPGALADVKSDDLRRRTAAFRRIAATPPEDGRRTDVVAELEKGLGDQWPDARIAAAKGLASWSGKKSIPAYARSLEGLDASKFHEVVLDILAEFKSDEAAEVIAKRVPNFFDGAKALQALKQLEPAMAEKAVLPLLDTAAFNERAAVCKALGEVGGKDSVGPLEKWANDTNVQAIHWRTAAKDALVLVKARVERNKK